MTDHTSRLETLAKPVAISCQTCPWARSCLPRSLLSTEVERLDSIIKRSRPLRKDEFLTRAGEPVRNVFVLRSGACKSYLLSRAGDVQVTGFYLPGELIGLDALGNRRHPSYSVTLETSMVCTISVSHLEQLASHMPRLRRKLLAIMSKQLHEEHELQRYTREVAEQRLIFFLLHLSRRYAKRGLSPAHFTLPMSRKDIANYLGLTSETLSRLFTRFRQQGLIDGQGHDIRLPDIARLVRQSNSYVEDAYSSDTMATVSVAHEPPAPRHSLIDPRKKTPN